MRSTPTYLLSPGSKTEHVTRRDAVLASEFYTIPSTNKQNGLTGYFVSPEAGALRGWVSSDELGAVVSTSPEGRFIARQETDQALRPWNEAGLLRLGLEREDDTKLKNSLRLKRRQDAQSERERPVGYQLF